jgi:hypothetical protein
MIRHRVATLGRPGPAWPRAVARWGSSATLPLDATTCVSAEELRSLVRSAPVTLAIVEAGLPGVDRVLAADVRQAGVALAVVDGPALGGAVDRLEPDAVLPVDFDPDALAAVLQAHTRTQRREEPTAHGSPDATAARLVAVTGTAGAGASTVAQALATSLADGSSTLLADLALDADQQLRHGVTPGHDGVFELAEALRHAPPEAVEPKTARIGGYDLLCGLRRRQEWVALSETVTEQLLGVLRRDRDHVVADVSPELDGQAETGSIDIEERNGLARMVIDRAAVVVVVGHWSTTGVPRLVRLLGEIERHGVPRERLRPVLNRGPRTAAGRTAAIHAISGLLDDLGTGPWPRPVALPHERRVEGCLREARPLPARLVARAAAALDQP